MVTVRAGERPETLLATAVRPGVAETTVQAGPLQRTAARPKGRCLWWLVGVVFRPRRRWWGTWLRPG